MMPLLRTTALLGLLLGLMLLPMGCSGSEGETTGELPPFPSPRDPFYVAPVEISFTKNSDGRFEVSGEYLGGGKGKQAGRVTHHLVDLRMPAQIDGAQEHLTLTLYVDEETKVLDRSGDAVPWSKLEPAFDSATAWTAMVRSEGPQPWPRALELRELKRPDSSLPPPIVTGLLEERGDGLVDVPGMPIGRTYKNGEVRVEMEQQISFQGSFAVATCNLAIDDDSEVVMSSQGEGSRDELLERMGRFDWPGGWQATARLEEDGTLTLVKLVGTAPPGD